MVPQYGSVPSTPFPPPNPNYPGYASQPVANNWSVPPAPAPAPRMPVMAALATGTPNAHAAPRPTIRMQAPDALLARPTPQVRPTAAVILPSPEALGIRAASSIQAAAMDLDWNSAHARLQRLGALGFHMVRLSEGSVRVTFMLPAGAQRAHEIEVIGASEAAAVSAALENAESWAVAKR